MTRRLHCDCEAQFSDFWRGRHQEWCAYITGYHHEDREDDTPADYPCGSIAHKPAMEHAAVYPLRCGLQSGTHTTHIAHDTHTGDPAWQWTNRGDTAHPINVRKTA